MANVTATTTPAVMELYPCLTPGCDQLIRPQIEFMVYTFLAEASACLWWGWDKNRDILVGLSNAQWLMNAGLARAVFVAIDFDDSDRSHVALAKTRVAATANAVPIVYSLGRRFLTKIFGGNVAVNAVSLRSDAQLTHEQERQLRAILCLVQDAREQYAFQESLFAAYYHTGRVL
jgi:predicted Co/Zn/Cd cation transporter (cation efflux family)